MTEQEYMDVTDLALLHTVVDVLRMGHGNYAKIQHDISKEVERLQTKTTNIITSSEE